MDLTALTALSGIVSTPPSATSDLNTIQAALQTLERSLGVGNLSAAQAALTQLQKASAHLNSAGTVPSTSTQTTADLATLATALGKNDLHAAKTALPALQTDLAGIDAQAITAAADTANQLVQQLDAILNISDAGSQASAAATPDVGKLTSTLLSSVYGNHSTIAPSTTAPTTSSTVNVSA